MFTVSLYSKNFVYNASTPLHEILREHYDKYSVAALIDGRIYDLNKVIDFDCTIEPVDLTSEDGMRIYLRTLKFVFIMAVKRLFPGAEVKFMYSISRGQYCEINNVSMNIEKVRLIEEEMFRIIKQNIPFVKETISKDEAQKIYKHTYSDKADLLRFRPEDTVHIYRCSKECNYLYGYMMPSTGYLRSFKLHFNSPGIVLLYPRHELRGQIPDFEPSVKFDRTLWRAEEWGKICGISNICDLNQAIENGKIRNIVNMAEIRHENEIEKIAGAVADDIKNIKVILIAGPSSSGKTTLSKKLQAHLAVNGIRSITLSTDDYFIDRNLFDNNNGEVDFEHINRINIKKFNEDLVDLIAGREVLTPKYNFKTGKSEDGNVFKIDNDECIIVEGIHGLNEALTPLVPRYNKYKIFISALTHINIDDHTPVSTTTCRLIRRIVRDNCYRNTSIEDTLSMWKSVREGEFRWIYPYQEEADYIFNSELTYELAVLKKHVMPLVSNIDTKSKYYIASNKILKILKYVESVDDDIVPNTSILREFIGGSNY